MNSRSASSCNLALASRTNIAGLLRGSGPVGLAACAGFFELLGCCTVDVEDMVGLGCTGPMERKERAKSGSDASRLIASDLDVDACEVEACGGGCTEGPGLGVVVGVS